jgi:hypothetical protein
MRSKAGEPNLRGWLAITAGALGLLVTASLAMGADLSTNSKSVEVDPESVGTVTAKCKQGEKVTSGGFASPVAAVPGDPILVPHVSRKQGGRKWTVASQNFSEAASGTLTSFVYCREASALHTKSASTTVPGQPVLGEAEIGSVSVKCKRGEKAISGGFANPDFGEESQVIPFESRKQGGRKWTVSAISAGDESATLAAYVYCRDGKGLKKASKTGPAGPSDFDMGGQVGSGKVTAKCDKGQRVVSGGFDNPDFGPDRNSDPQLVPSVSKKQGGRKWTVSSVNNGLASGTVTAFAYCEKK